MPIGSFNCTGFFFHGIRIEEIHNKLDIPSGTVKQPIYFFYGVLIDILSILYKMPFNESGIASNSYRFQIQNSSTLIERT